MSFTLNDLKMLHDAQLHYVRQYLTPFIIERLNISDDENDYVNSLLELANDLRTVVYNCQFDSTLNDDEIIPDHLMPFNVDDVDHDDYIFNKYACDGVAPEFHDAFTVYE